MKLVAFRLIALAAQCLAIFCILEIGLRVFPSLISPPLLTHFPAPLRHQIAEKLNYPSVNRYTVISTTQRTDGGPPIYHPAPDTVFAGLVDISDIEAGAVIAGQADAHGFCNPLEKGLKKHADIVVLGDSFTACTAIAAENSATNYLQEISGFTTYNLGVGGIGVYEYVELLKTYGLALSPRMVIMNIYEGNDIRDAVRYQKFRRTGRDRRATENAIERTLSKSYALSLLYALKEWLVRDQVQWLFDDERRVNYRYSVLSEGSRVELNVTNHDRGEVRDAGRLINNEISLELWSTPLRTFKQLSQMHRFIPVVSYTPTAHTTYLDSVQFEDREVGKLVKEMSDRQRAWLKSTTAELDIPFIDLTPAFQHATHEGPLTHFPANVHLTPAGHKVAATEWNKTVSSLISTHSDVTLPVGFR